MNDSEFLPTISPSRLTIADFQTPTPTVSVQVRVVKQKYYKSKSSKKRNTPDENAQLEEASDKVKAAELRQELAQTETERDRKIKMAREGAEDETFKKQEEMTAKMLAMHDELAKKAGNF